MSTQATTPAAPALLSARGSLPAGAPGPAPARAAAKAERVQTIGPDHLRWAKGALECYEWWAPGLSTAPPVGVKGPVGPSGWLEPRAMDALLLGLFPGSLVLSLGAITVSPLGHWSTPLPSMIGGPGVQWEGRCPAAAASSSTAAAQIKGILPFIDHLGHGSGISPPGLRGSVLGSVNLTRSDGQSEEPPQLESLMPRASDCDQAFPLHEDPPLSSPLARSSFRITVFRTWVVLPRWVG